MNYKEDEEYESHYHCPKCDTDQIPAEDWNGGKECLICGYKLTEKDKWWGD